MVTTPAAEGADGDPPAGSRRRPAAGAGARPARPQRGPVERKVRSEVRKLKSAHPLAGSLAEMAYALARLLDEGAGLATAAVNRELRANLTELARVAGHDDDDLEDELSQPE